MKTKKLMLAAVMSIAVFFAGCVGNIPAVEAELPETWDEIIADARNTQVRIFMWGGSESVNAYIDEYVSPRLSSLYGIELQRIPLSDIRDIVSRLLEEKDAGKSEGKADILWINGENFKEAKDGGILWKMPGHLPPNYINLVDAESQTIHTDFGEPVEDYERPWGRSQLVFIYDIERTPVQPFVNLQSLLEWTVGNPGRFTYPAPPDFTGSAFVRLVFGEIDGYRSRPVKMDLTDVGDEVGAAMQYLKTLEPNLWKGGLTYPESSGKLDQMFSAGEVDVAISYNPNHALNMKEAGMFPDTVRTFILNGGTLSNTHYLAIPESSRNKAGALAAIDFLLSEEAQLEKLDPANWGDGTVLSYGKLGEESKAALESICAGAHTLTQKKLEEGSRPELSSEYVDYIERRWYENVAKE